VDNKVTTNIETLIGVITYLQYSHKKIEFLHLESLFQQEEI